MLLWTWVESDERTSHVNVKMLMFLLFIMANAMDFDDYAFGLDLGLVAWGWTLPFGNLNDNCESL